MMPTEFTQVNRNTGFLPHLEGLQGEEFSHAVAIAMNEVKGEYQSMLDALVRKYDDVIATQASQGREIAALKSRCAILEQENRQFDKWLRDQKHEEQGNT